MSPEKDKETDNSAKRKTKKSPNLVLLLVCIVALICVGIVVLVRKDKTPSTTTSSLPKTGVTLSLVPDNSTATQGKTLTLAVWVDTNGRSVNAVQADLNYPTDKFKFESIDSVDSAFKIGAESSGGDGKITIARGETGTITGKQLVAKINLTPLTGQGKADVTFADSSAVVQSTDNTNVLGSTVPGHYKLESK